LVSSSAKPLSPRDQNSGAVERAGSSWPSDSGRDFNLRWCSGFVKPEKPIAKSLFSPEISVSRCLLDGIPDLEFRSKSSSHLGRRFPYIRIVEIIVEAEYPHASACNRARPRTN